MTPTDADTHELVTFADLKPLAIATGPCITAVIDLNNPAEVEERVRNAIRGVEKKLAERAIHSRAAADLLTPIQDLATHLRTARLSAHSVILFRSPSLFRYYLLHGQFQSMETAGDRFHVRPLLQTLAHETRFYLLALSRHHVRLLRCTQHHAEPVDTGGSIPRNLEDWMTNRDADHILATDRDRTDRYLVQFAEAIDKAVAVYLHGATEPLVLAGVEREIAAYRRVNSYRPTFENAATGSPDDLPDAVLHERAMQVVTSTFSEPLRRAMAEIREHGGAARVSTDLRAIVRAAFQGRVLDLILAADAEYLGTWNEQTQDVETSEPREDLLNAASLQTISHDGYAFVVKRTDLPVEAAAVALFRF